MSRYAGLILLAVVMAIAAIYSYWTMPQEAGPVVAGVPPATTTMPDAAKSPVPIATGGDGFDFYVLALSWSPTFCETQGDNARSQQCGTGSGFGMIVHGLWPQNETGYPQDCATNEPERVPAELGRRYFDIMPGMGLIGHQWRKHGTCSGLGQADYFALVRKAFQRIDIPQELARPLSAVTLSPAEIEKRFTSANPGLSTQGISVQCEGEKFEEVRICLTRDLAFRACAEVDRQSCRRNSVMVPPVR